jgi:hypothetical protein
MMLGVHPSRIPALLRFAVNQEHCMAASFAVQHLTEVSSEVLEAMQQERRRVLEHLQQPEFADSIVAQAMLEGDQTFQQQMLERHQEQQQQITPQLLEELLLLAATRKNYALVIRLLEVRPTVSLQLPSAAVATLLDSLIRSKIKPQSALDFLVASLCELPAAAEISVTQLTSLLRQALIRRQLNSVSELCGILAARVDFDSTIAYQVLLPVVRSSWSEGLEWMEARGVLQVLQPQHTEQLLQQALLIATLAGAGMQPAWCDIPASDSSSSSSSEQEEALPVELAVLKSLYNSDAGHDIDDDQELRLLLTAAALGNAGALALLRGSQDTFAGGADAVVQLLHFAVQYRSGAMLELTAPLLCNPEFKFEDTSSVSELALASLLRAGDMAQLNNVLTELAAVWPAAQIEREQENLLQVAGQLGRCSSIRALCSEQSWWAVHDMQVTLPFQSLEDLLQLAVRRNSPATVQSLLQLPSNADVPERLQMVHDLTEQEHQRQRAVSAAAHMQHSSTLQQLQQRSEWQRLQTRWGWMREKQYEGLTWYPAALLHAMQDGLSPDDGAHSALPPPSGDALGADKHDLFVQRYYSTLALCELLEVALQLPPGVQQQAWLELLCHSRLAAHMDDRMRMCSGLTAQVQLLLVAVHAAYAGGSCAGLRMLCETWQQLGASDTYLVVAAAVQISHVPAVRLLLTKWPAAQQLEAHQVAALLRWTISSSGGGGGSSSSSSSSSAYSTFEDGQVEYSHSWQPVTPCCSPACAEMLRLLCGLPAAGQIATYDMVGLLVYAMQQSNIEAVQQLCKLNAAAEFDGACVRGLLRWARVVGSRPGRDAVVGALCGLPAVRGARGLKAADVNKLLQLYDAADALMGWSAAASQQEGVVPAEVRLKCVL